MTDDLERNLDEFYRGFDRAAWRVEKRWQGATRRLAPVRPPSIGPWIAAAAVAAAAVLLVVGLRSGAPDPTVTVTKRPDKRDGVRPPEKREEPKPAPEPVVPTPAPEPDPIVKPEPKPEPPKPVVPPVEPPKPEPKPEPAPTKPLEAERAIAVLREIEGSFDLAGRKLSGKQKEVRVAAGDRLKATSVTRLTLADSRFLLLGAKAQITITPEEKRLVVTIEQGDVLAELIGPGGAVHFVTTSCEIDHVGTVFAMKVDERRTIVAVEEGRVECTSAKGKVSIGEGQQVTATDGLFSTPAAADPRATAWTKGHRPAERVRFAEDFVNVGAWKADVANGVAKAVPDAEWCTGKLQLEGDAPLFAIPTKGRMTIVCKADRAGPLIVQIHCVDPKVNFRRELSITRGNAWQTIVIDVDDFVPTVKGSKEKLLTGAAINELYLMYGEPGGKGGFWVDSITVTEVR